MIVTYVRSSSYNNYDYCQMQYFITYALGHQSTSGKKAQLGTIVHKVMECLGSCKKKLQEGKKTGLSIIDDGIGEIKFSNRTLYTKKFVKELLDRSYEYYTKNCVHNYTGADMKFCKKLVDDALTYNDGQFDPRNRNVVASEPQFDIPIEEEWAKYKYKMPNGEVIEGQLAIKGTIDLVTQVGDDVIEVVDWKTGRRLNWATGEEKLTKNYLTIRNSYCIIMLYPNFFLNTNRQS